MATIETPGVLGTFHGSDEFPIEWQEGETRALLDLRRPALPQPGVAAVLRHRRLVADVRPHVPPLRHAVRVATGSPRAINGYVYTAAIPADPSVRAEATEYQARYVAARAARRRVRRRDRRLPRLRPARTTPRTSSTGGRDRLRPEIERNFAYLDGQRLRTARRSLELAVLLEDAIDIHDRHWKIHWMLNFAQFSATTAPQRRDRGGRAARPTRAARPAAVARSRTATGTRSRTCGA